MNIMRIKKRSNNFLLFCILTGVVVLAALLYFFTHRHGDMVLLINHFSANALDPFFFVVTDIGLGSMAAVIAFLLFLYRFHWGLLMGVGLLFTSLFTNILKRHIFLGVSRPLLKLCYTDFTRWIDGVELNWHRSFPSGHTMTIFAVCVVLAYLFNRRGLTVFFFVLAVLVGVSRMYLLQHFLIDVTAGAVLGLIASGLALLIVNRWWKVDMRSWGSYSILYLFSQRRKDAKANKS